MIRDITIGQYYPAKSCLHALDPRVKLAGTMAFILSLFLFDGYIGYIVATLFLATVIKLSKVPFSFMVRGLKAVVMLLMFTVIFNLFLTRQGTEIFAWKFIHIYDEGIILAVTMGFRLILLIIGSSLMTLTTTPNQLTDGMEKLLAPFNKIHVPVHEIAMMMSIALRFIPILLEETDKIMKAQQARGADFESGNLLARAKALIPILVPLFVSAFRIAQDLAMAMEARCYRGGQGRTRMHEMRFQRRDYIMMLLLILFLALTIFMRMNLTSVL